MGITEGVGCEVREEGVHKSLGTRVGSSFRSISGGGEGS